LILCHVLLSVIIAILEVWVFSFIGDLVDWIAQTEQSNFWLEYAWLIALMGVVIMIVLPIFKFISDSIQHQGLMGNFPMRIRWQAHRYLLRHSVTFFEDDFAGGIATKVMQTALAVRDTVLKLSSIFVYVLVYFSTTIVLFALSDWRLTLPLLFWLVGYLLTLRYFVPKFREISKLQAENRSQVTGRMVDSYSNIHTVKMFSNHRDEDAYVKEGMNDFLDNVHYQMRMATLLNTTLTVLNSSLIFSIGAVSLYLWDSQLITVGVIAFAFGIVMRIQGLSQWTLWEVASLFENIGVVQDGMQTLARERKIQDQKDAQAFIYDKGSIVFENIRFNLQ
jgi:ABC-type multidrug transport system, ATPase and permease components